MQTLGTRNGPLTYIEQGSGAALVLLHGIQGTARTWDKVAELLESRYRVIRPNLRGRAGSHTPPDSQFYSLEGFAEDLAAVLEWVDEPAVLVAWSMGVSVTLELLRSRAHPPLRGLLLVSGTACAGDKARWFSDGSAAQVAEEARTRGVALSLTEAAAPHAVAASWQHVRQTDLRGTLAAIALPVQILHGTLDDQCPIAHGRQLAGAIAGARMEEWEGIGHNPMAAAPQQFVEAVARFAASLAPCK